MPITPPVAAIAAQVLVAQVAMVVPQRPGARMSGHDRAGRKLEDVVDRCRGKV